MAYEPQAARFRSARDSVLAASGQSDSALDGPAVELTAMPWTHRRTLYGLIDRQNFPELVSHVRFRRPRHAQPARYTTTVPQQALFMMNSPFLPIRRRNLAVRGEWPNRPIRRDAFSGYTPWC